MGEVTVFCAVWHKDPARHALLAGHRENLRRQSVPVRPLYVFDGGDAPPDWLDAESILAENPLTIYQAWNLALASVSTPLTMNLNLDDRLAPDAVEKLTQELEKSGAMLVGGDWRICYSQEETDTVLPCRPVAELSTPPSWPPPRGAALRLGSGTGGSTYGPATLWRMSVHRTIPRYPWRLTDGRTIKAVGDGIFWDMMKRKGLRLGRLPQIVGNYHSHPREQAEFRQDSLEEWRIASTIGVAIL